MVGVVHTAPFEADKTKWKIYTVHGNDKTDRCTIYHVLTRNGKPYSVEPDWQCDPRDIPGVGTYTP